MRKKRLSKKTKNVKFNDIPRYTILIVDDDDAFRNEFRECFNEYTIIEAPTGKEAIEIMKKPNQIDLVTLDVRMPGMDGIQTLNEIKRINPDIGVVMITGFGTKEVVINSLRGQADNYIEKPFDIETTKNIIEKVILSRKGINDDDEADLSEKVEKVKRFMQRNLFKKVSLNDAAAAICLSPKYLSRIFKQQTGMEFTLYRISLKIKEARNLLENTGFNIDQISRKLGYKNTESFTRQFKKTVHMTPTEYRNKRKNLRR